MLRRFTGLMAAGLFATGAHAIPITFEFSGTDYRGVRASGQFLIETAGMRTFDFGPGDPWMQRNFSDLIDLNDRPFPMHGSLNIGDEAFVLGDYPAGGYGGLVFFDVCQPECMPNTRENWSIQMFEQDFPFGDQPGGSYISRNLSFMTGPQFGENADLFDWATVRPEDILTLPLLRMDISYYETVFDCSSGACASTRRNEHQFQVDTVVRSAGQTVSVPEPGSFGLLGAALAGVFLARRRTAAARGAFN